MKFFVAVLFLTFCALTLAEDNIDEPTQNGASTYKRDVENTDDDKNIEKRSVFVLPKIYPYAGYSGLYGPSYLRLIKRDTTDVENNNEEKHVEKRSIVYTSYNDLYPYYSGLYGLRSIPEYFPTSFLHVKRETEETNEHAVQKRDVSDEETPKIEDKRDLILGYGAPYYPLYRSYPYYSYIQNYYGY